MPNAPVLRDSVRNRGEEGRVTFSIGGSLAFNAKFIFSLKSAHAILTVNITASSKHFTCKSDIKIGESSSREKGLGAEKPRMKQNCPQ